MPANNLITSAAPGRKAAPKAPARRRPAPAAPPTPSATPAPTAETAAPGRPPSPPPSQSQPTNDATVVPQKEPTPSLPEPEAHVPSLPEKEPIATPDKTPLQTPRAPDFQASEIDRPLTPPPAQSQPRADVASQQEFGLPTPLVPSAAPNAPTTAPVQVPPVLTAEAASIETLPSPPPTQTQSREQTDIVPQQEPVPPRVDPGAAAQPLLASTSAPSTRTKRVRAEEPSATAPRPAKRTKRSSVRSNATAQAVAQEEEEPSTGVATTQAENRTQAEDSTLLKKSAQKRKAPTRKQPPAKRRATTKAKSAPTIVNSDDENEGQDAEETSVDGTEPAAKATRSAPKKRQRKRKEPRQAPLETSAEGEEQQLQEEEEQPAEEDSDAEAHEIDPKTLSMWDLSHDDRHGKTSERGRRMAELPWDEIQAKRRAEADAIAAGAIAEEQPSSGSNVVQSTEGVDGTDDDPEQAQQGRDGSPPAEPSEYNNQANSQDMQFAVDENGEIILPDSNLDIVRGAEAHAAAASQDQIEDINDLTTHITRTTWMNNNRRDPVDRVPAWKWKSDPWSEEETDRFYEALQMFGTDFFVISKMFPPKTRRMIKAKFNREEKLDPRRVNDALSGKSTKPMSLEHYSQATGRDMAVFTKYESVQHAESIINESMRDKQEQMTTQLQQETALAEEKAAKERQEKKARAQAKKDGQKTKRGKKAAGGTMGGGPEDATAADD
ncbi:Transcription factor TFIIIB component B [Lecanosticta acicola]|uniref:Transcription factor TFIIIB component B n=1 Tax=Lecanosticta acicola TaxID=111012 RepID=A0AAI8YSV4_9PEZI|nr:Transcription factor TFIIIB component B [Lecanosticta acicola]